MIGAKANMIQSMNKRSKCEVACSSTPEGALSFYKRPVGLNLLALSSATSGLPQESQPSDRHRYSVRPTHPTANTEIASVNTVTNSLSLHAQPGRPHGHQSDGHQEYHSSDPHENQSGHSDGYESSNPYEYQSNNTNGYHTTHHHGYQFTDFLENQAPARRTDFANNDAFHRPQKVQSHQVLEHQSHPRADLINNGGFHQQQPGHHPQTLQSQHAQQVPRPRPRPARKEPQVKPIDKYSPPDYLKIMYHPTPTLEDLGLTSYLDSPPSSPRTVSPAREEPKENVVSGTGASQPTVSKGEVQSKVSGTATFGMYKQTTTQAPWKLIKITLPPVTRITLEERLAAAPKQTDPEIGQSMDNHAKVSKTLLGEKHTTALSRATMAVVDQSNHEKPRDFIKQQQQTNILKDRRALCVSPSGVSSTAPPHRSCDGQLSELTVGIAAKRKALESSSGETDRPKKKICVWATAAEQYVTDSNKSECQDAKRDAAYKRYNSDARFCMRQQMTDTTRHQYQEPQCRSHRTESYDQILAHEKARQNVGLSRHKIMAHSVRRPNHDTVFITTMDADLYSKSQQTTGVDIFGGMSPFSCWSQTTPWDPRFS